MPSAVALFSGGLDSMLAVRILQREGFQVEGLHVRTLFRCCQVDAAQMAALMGIRLTVVTVDDDYLDLIRHPMFGYGRGINPCVDCRIYMARLARRRMEQLQADLVITGEVLGQRPMSQKRRDLDVVQRHSGLEGRLLRPLSARLLPPTLAEQQGMIQRDRLYGFAGSGRRKLLELAARLGLPEPPTPSVGCALTQPTFACKVRDLLRWQPQARRWDFDLLNYGRHVYLPPSHGSAETKSATATNKVVLGRNARENAILQQFAARPDASPSRLLEPENFQGPTALIVGPPVDAAVRLAGELILAHTRYFEAGNAKARLDQGGQSEVIQIVPAQQV